MSDIEPFAKVIAALGEVLRHAVQVAAEHGDGCGMEVIRDHVYGEPEACEGLPERKPTKADDLTTRIAEVLVGYTTGGLCPLNGPCDACDCFEPMHPRERDMAASAVKEVAKHLREITKSANLRAFMHRNGLGFGAGAGMVLHAVADEIDGDERAEQAEAAARQRAEEAEAAIARVRELCDRAEWGAKRWEDPLPVPEWVSAVRAALDGEEEPTDG